MKVASTLLLGNPVRKAKLQDHFQWLRLKQLYEFIAKAVNGGIEFGNPTSGSVNIMGQWASVTCPAVANTDFTVTHNLGKACVGYLLCTKDRAVDVYTSPTVNSSPTTKVILRASVASAVITLFLF